MSDVFMRAEYVEHVRRFEAKLERFVARENPNRDELLEWIRLELTLRVLVAETDLPDHELAQLINSTPI